MTALDALSTWPVDHRAAAVLVLKDGSPQVAETTGEQQRTFALASVTKPLVAYALALAVQEGALEYDDAVPFPEGATVRHLVAHAAGLDLDSERVRYGLAERRMYSNQGFVYVAEALERATEIPWRDYVREAVFEPLGMTSTTIEGAPGAGGVSTVADLSAFAAELLAPNLLDPSLLNEVKTVQFPGLDGLLPGYGTRKPNDWGLGFEIRDHKSPHWTGTSNSPETFGHFGQSGTFLWVDPVIGVATVVLTDRDFGPWAQPLWTEVSDLVVSSYSNS
ncbi:serine hydrolase domain-containing protein [Neomicrococcus lactis]